MASDRSALIRECARLVALARLHGGAARWARVHEARRRLKALPVRWREREAIIDALVADANRRPA